MDGFVNSQTWEAWFESYEVLWDNTSYIFVISVALSLVIALATYLMPIGSQDVHKPKMKTDEDDINARKQEQDLGEDILEDVQRVDAKDTQRRAIERMETQMTAEQREAEREAQSQQLAAILKMMQEQEEKFGKTSIADIKDQMKLYCG